MDTDLKSLEGKLETVSQTEKEVKQEGNNNNKAQEGNNNKAGGGTRRQS